MAVKDLCRRHGFSEASYDLWRSKFGGLEVSDATRLKALDLEHARLKRLLAEALLEQAVTREVLRKKWSAHQLVGRAILNAEKSTQVPPSYVEQSLSARLMVPRDRIELSTPAFSGHGCSL